MYLAINSVEIATYPSEFRPKIMDLDNAETTLRTADGKLSRDRVAVKRQIDMTFPALENAKHAALLQSMSDEFFSFTYPDPMTGEQETKTFYVSDRQSAMAIIKNGVVWWTDLQFTLTEE